VTPRRILRVIVAEDDEAVRAALVALIDGAIGLDLVGTATDAIEAIKLAAATQPDVALLDVRMPHGGGVAAARGMLQRSPSTKVIALSAAGDRSTVLNMLEAGAVGYLLKGGPVDEILKAIEHAPAGHASLSVEVAGDVIKALTGRLRSRSQNLKRSEVLERSVRRAIRDEGAFTIVFQPIVGLVDGVTVGVEALARFAGQPTQAPNLWFAKAASFGLQTQLELVAVRKALGALPHLPRGNFLAVNVSPETLTTAAFRELVASADGERLVVEVTEHAPVPDYSCVDDALCRLRALGVRLAIDDAGAGFASLRHILRLSPDLIKLDVSLIRDIHVDGSKQALAAGLISFAERIGASIIAEGIEQVEEAQALIELGVGYGQGYFFGRPGSLHPDTRRGRLTQGPSAVALS
jgi:EAL domain-containing protein (putative c-di-GMP-specific phosphodiesterase class I)/DNA-binding NarL/FixJ family response regulator